jgi:hypothetical protein
MIKDVFGNFLRSIHYSIPVSLRHFYMPLVNTIRNLKLIFPKLYYIEGEESSGGSQMKVAYVGLDERILNYWLELFFTQKTLTKTEISIPVWKIRTFLRHNAEKADLALIELNNVTKPIVNLQCGFLLPRWLEVMLNVDAPLRIRQIDTLKRRIRKFNLTCEKRYAVSDLAFFYKRMYVPYISTRHKDASVIADYIVILDLFNQKGSQLYFILKDGEPVAGAIDSVQGKILRMGVIGVLDGRQDLFNMGVVGASYYFRMLDYKERNLHLVNMGGTSPILTDGLTQYKLSLGAEIAKARDMGDLKIMLLPLRDSLAVKNVLKSNPFIYLGKKNTYRGIFCSPDEAEKAGFLEIYKRTACDNIKETIVYCFNEVNNMSDWIEKEPGEEVKYMPYKIGDRIKT